MVTKQRKANLHLRCFQNTSYFCKFKAPAPASQFCSGWDVQTRFYIASKVMHRDVRLQHLGCVILSSSQWKKSTDVSALRGQSPSMTEPCNNVSSANLWDEIFSPTTCTRAVEDTSTTSVERAGTLIVYTGVGDHTRAATPWFQLRQMPTS